MLQNINEGVFFMATVSLLGITDLLASAHSQNDGALNGSYYQTGLTASLISALNKITVQPGPVEVKQGNNASLWCKLEYDSTKRVPVYWQSPWSRSPPTFKTRTGDCDTYGNSHEKRKYVMSCSKTSNQIAFYNLTITDVKWADRGEHRCVHISPKGIVDLRVLVPVTDVTLTKEFKRIAADPSIINAVLTCETNCAFPAPNISWFDSNQPYKGRASETNTNVGCTGVTEGQKQTKSTITVLGTDKNKKEHIISCAAENVLGEKKISRTIDINYNRSYTTDQADKNGTPNPPQAVMTVGNVALVAVPVVVVIIVVVGFGIAITFMRRKNDKKSRSAIETNKKILERLLEDFKNFNFSEIQDPEGTDLLQVKNANVLLMLASKFGALDMLQAALKDEADVNATNEDGSTALIIASEKGKLDVVEALLVARADVNIRNKAGKTAQMIAFENGNIDVVNALDDRADVNTANQDEREVQYSQRSSASGGSTSLEMSIMNQAANMEPLLSDQTSSM